MQAYTIAAVALSFVLGSLFCHLVLSRKVKKIIALNDDISNDYKKVIREQRELIIKKDILIVKQQAMLEKSNEIIKTYIECNLS